MTEYLRTMGLEENVAIDIVGSHYNVMVLRAYSYTDEGLPQLTFFAFDGKNLLGALHLHQGLLTVYDARLDQANALDMNVESLQFPNMNVFG